MPLIAFVGIAVGSVARAEAPVDFVRDVQPILAKHCYACHGPANQEGGLRLSSRDSAMSGGDSGQKAIVPGDEKASRLLVAIGGADPDFKMPPEGEGEPLTAEQVALLTRWVKEGAVWPREADPAGTGPKHWAWEKPLRAALPQVKRADWPRHPLDYFVLERIEREGLSPAPEATRHALVRRVHLDLIGLPPTPAAVQAFVSDTGPDAYERMVDRVLADPAYGERWARVWLDLARYADSKGYGSDPLRSIWRYRDWVIEAFNRNLPYDRFTIEQLAGDLLPQPTSDQLLATAFHRNTMANDEGGTDDEEFRVAAVKDRIETTLQVWMGLTVGCAKCHSHKFDPITQREYYQAYAFFNQTEDADRGDEAPLAPTPTTTQLSLLAAARATLAEQERLLAAVPSGLEGEIDAWEKSIAAADADWHVLPPTKAESDNDLALEIASDTVRAGGPAPEKAVYRVTADAAQTGITALRLEVLPDDAMPERGPGWNGGNFVLNEVGVSAGPRAGEALAPRYVRIELPGDNRIIQLAEVQVFDGAENLAPNGKATQSSSYGGAEAARAIDGRTSGIFDEGSVSHTGEETNPWWELDLGQPMPVRRLVVWNRNEHDLHSRLNGSRLIVLDAERRPLWQQTIVKAEPASQEFNLTGPSPLELAAATADFSQSGFPASKLIDGDVSVDNGWAIAPEYGKPHVAVLALRTPLAAPAQLTVTLTQTYGTSHRVGRFRLSVTTAASAAPALPRAIAEIIATPNPSRTTEHRAELARHYWQQSEASRPIRDRIAQLGAQIESLEKQIPSTPILRELPADKRRVTHTMVKGNFLQPGEAVQPATPAALHPFPADAPLDRMGLALWLVDRDNPLTARVMVNRLWAQLFGLGLVATEEDFGTQGLPPSHPQLLDWLAVAFVEGGWDIKALLRKIVMSATYRQSSIVGTELVRKDPNNLLLARGPRARLEAEMVRDQALAIAGLLDQAQGGPSVYPPQPDGLWRAAFNGQRTWATSTGGDRYRRGLYTYWRRSVPYPSMAVFDAPSREICTLRRISTNTPLQAFVMLNDPVYVEAAQALARRIVIEGGGTTAERCAFVLQLALARPASPEQVKELVALYEEELSHYRQDATAAVQMASEPLGAIPQGQDAAELAAWTVVANVVLNLDGVLTKR